MVLTIDEHVSEDAERSSEDVIDMLWGDFHEIDSRRSNGKVHNLSELDRISADDRKEHNEKQIANVLLYVLRLGNITNRSKTERNSR